MRQGRWNAPLDAAGQHFAIDERVMESPFGTREFATAPPVDVNSSHELTTISSLLRDLDETQQAAPDQPVYQTQLVERRLGLATSLFTALRLKHAPSAAHSLRVALGVSSWACALDFSESQRDLVEMAALLHDIGKVGVPDHILLKPGRLTGEESQMMERHAPMGREILSSCSASADFLDTVYYAMAWYDGTKRNFDRHSDQLPLGSRMIAIVDAFDSMTTDHVYRRALSRERALAELFQHSGTQFDANLVHGFCRLLTDTGLQFKAHTARRWLHEIHSEEAESLWSYHSPLRTNATREVELAFQERLLDAMHDGVIFVDHRLMVLMWNRAAERLTGISPNSVTGRRWDPGLIRLSDDRGRPFSEEDCPVLAAMRSGIQTHQRFGMAGRLGRHLSVDMHVAPVLMPGGQVQGVAIILHDASSQTSLEERVQALHERATRDPLTKVANRAEFDRVFPEFVSAHLEQRTPCSLIMCDVDHFKRVNDTHGHQAGDEALIVFATHLQRHARATDLVARYGGEEFVVLCADCDNTTATRRAEEMRRGIAETPQPALGKRCLTASFGVTEIQGGDTPETFLRRADRALLQAKDGGRNAVVQLGTGITDPAPEGTARRWLAWLRPAPAATLLERNLTTVVPLAVAAEKLRGFVADQHAEILSIEGNRVLIKVDGQAADTLRRGSDRPVPFTIELTFAENKPAAGERREPRSAADMPGTLIHVMIRPHKQRDRRQNDAVQRARQLLGSLKSYLMAQDAAGDSTKTPAPPADPQGAERALADWLQT